MANKIGVVLALDGEKEFSQGMKNAQESTKLCDQALKNLKDEYKENANSLEALSKKQEALTKKQEAYKRTLDQAKNGQKHAVENYKKCGKALEDLRKDLDKAEDALKDMEKAGDTTSKAYLDQKKAVENLQKAVEKQATEYAKAEGNITAWDTKVLKAEGDVRKCDKAITENAKYLDEAAKSADGCATSIDNMGNKVADTGRDLDGAGNSAKNFWGKMKEGMALKAGAMITGALSTIASKAVEAGKQLVQCGIDAASYADNILTASQVTGLSTDTLQEYAYAAELIDTSMEDVQGALAKNVKSMAKARKGSADYSDAYKKLGVSVTNANGNLRDSEDVFWECIDALGKVEDETERDAIAMQIFGRSAQDLNPLIAQGSTGFAKLAKEAHEAGAVLDSDTLTSLGGVDDSLQRLSSQTDAFKNAVGTTIAPAIELVADAATGVLKGITNSINTPKTELEQFISEIDALNKSTQESIKNAKAAMQKGDADVAQIDTLAGTIKEINEQFTIFTGTDTGELAKNVEGTASGVNSALSGMGNDADEAKKKLEGIKDAEVSSPESLTSTEQDISGKFGSMKQGIDSVKIMLDDLKNASVEPPESLDTAKVESVNDLGEISTAAGNATDSIEGIGAAEVKEPKGLIAVSGEIRPELSGIATDAASAKEGIDQFGEADIDGITSDLGQVGEAAEKSAEQMDEWSKFRLKNAVSELAQTIPEIGAAWDEVTGTLSMTEAEFDQLIEKQKIAIRAQALESAKIESVKAEMNAALMQRMSQNALEGIYSQVQELTGETVESIDDIESAYSHLLDAEEKSADPKAVSDLMEAAIKAEGELDEANKNLETSKTTMEGVEAAAAELSKEYGIDAVNAIKEAGAAAEETADAMSGLSEAEAEALQAARESEIVSAHQAAADKISAAYEEAKQSIIDSFKIDLGSEWDGGLDQTVEQMTENLASQIQGMQNYEQNLALVKDHVGKEIAPEFMDYLEGMGRDGANILAHIAKTFEQDNGSEVVQGLSDKYVQALDMSKELGKAGAADIVALKAKLGEFGSKAEEWTDLSGVVSKLQSEGGEISDATLAAFQEAVESAQAMGVAIPEGLEEGIESSADGLDAGVQHATDVLIAAMQGHGSELVSMAEAAGMTVPDSIKEGIAAGGDAAQTAMTELFELVSQAASDAEGAVEDAGSEIVDTAAGSIEDSASSASSSGAEIATQAAEGAKGKTGEMQSAGSALALAMAQGVQSQNSVLYSSGSMVAQSAKSGASGVGTSDIGYNLAMGIKSGIESGQSAVANALVALVKNAKSAGENAAGIKSPSKVFRDAIGKQLGAGVAVGITQSTKETVDAATWQMNRTLAALQAWTVKNKKKIGGAGQQWADNVAYAWKKLADIEVKNKFGIKQTSWKDKKYNNYSSDDEKKAASTNDYYSDIYRAAQQYMRNVQSLYHVSDQQQLDYWKKVKSGLKRGTQAWYDASGEIQKLTDSIKESEKQAAMEMRQQILSDAETYVKEQKEQEKMSLASEVAYWRKIREQLKKGTEEWKTVTQYIIDAKKQIGSINAADSLLDNYAAYYDLSLKAEMQYWNKVRTAYAAGTENRIAADKKYLDAKQKYEDKLKELEDDYAAKVEETNRKYTDALESRKAEIMSAYDLFDYFESSSASGQELLFNLQTQAAGYEEWNESIDELANKGILSEDLMQQLIDKGPNSIASVKALLTLTNDQLKDYQKAYDAKEAAAQKRAEKDTKDIESEVSKELADLAKQYDADLAKVEKTIDASLYQLAGNIKTIAEDQTAALVAAFTAAGSMMASSTGTSVSTDTRSAAGVSSSTIIDARNAQKYQDAGMKVSEAAEKAELYRQLNTAIKQAESAKSAVTKAEKSLTSANSALTKAQKALDTAKANQKKVNANKKSTSTQKTNAKNAVTTATTSLNNAKMKVSDAKKALSAAKAELKAKNKIVSDLRAQIKAKGYRTGSRRIGADGLIWMDEDGLGSEMIIRKADNAILTRAKPGDSIIPANLVNNLWKWGAIDPTALNTASMASLNQKLLDGYQAQARASSQQNARMDQMLELMAEFLPYLADRMTVPIESRNAVAVMSDDISRNMAARARRRR